MTECVILFYLLTASADLIELDSLQPFAKVSAPTCEEAQAKSDGWWFFHRDGELLATRMVAPNDGVNGASAAPPSGD